MKQQIKKLFMGCICFLSFTGVLWADTLTFDTGLEGFSSTSLYVQWDGRGGGHFFLNRYSTDEWAVFLDAPVYLNDFEMNYMPWEGYTGGSGDGLYISVHDSSDTILWSDTVYLAGYKNWSDWLTVSVETDDVAKIYFHQGAYDVQFWPSIDNMRINENPIPEPATMLLLGSGLIGLASARRKFRR